MQQVNGPILIRATQAPVSIVSPRAVSPGDKLRAAVKNSPVKSVPDVAIEGTPVYVVSPPTRSRAASPGDRLRNMFGKGEESASEGATIQTLGDQQYQHALPSRAIVVQASPSDLGPPISPQPSNSFRAAVEDSVGSILAGLVDLPPIDVVHQPRKSPSMTDLHALTASTGASSDLGSQLVTAEDLRESLTTEREVFEQTLRKILIAHIRTLGDLLDAKVEQRIGTLAETIEQRLQVAEASQARFEEQRQEIQASILQMQVEMFGAQSETGFKRGLVEQLHDLAISLSSIREELPTATTEQSMNVHATQITAFIEEACGDLHRKIAALEQSHQGQMALQGVQDRKIAALEHSHQGQMASQDVQDRIASQLQSETLARQEVEKLWHHEQDIITAQLRAETQARQEGQQMMHNERDKMATQLRAEVLARQNQNKQFQQDVTQMREALETFARQEQNTKLQQDMIQMREVLQDQTNQLKSLQAQTKTSDSLGLQRIEDQMRSMQLHFRSEMTRVETSCNLMLQGLVPRVGSLEAWKSSNVVRV